MSYDVPERQRLAPAVWSHKIAKEVAAHLGMDVSVVRDLEARRARNIAKLQAAAAAAARDDVRPDAVSPECLVFGECTIKI